MNNNLSSKDSNEIDILQEDNDKLQQDNYKLQKDYDKLQEEYDKLLNDYSENVIIQSMNDMKQKYDTLLRSTVSLYKHQILQDKFTNLIRSFSGCSVLIDHTIKVLKQSKNANLLDKKNLISKAELELITIKEILEDSIIFNTE